MQIDSNYTNNRYVSEDGTKIVQGYTMDDWADAGYVFTAENYDEDESVDVTLPEWTATERYYPCTPEGRRLTDL